MTEIDPEVGVSIPQSILIVEDFPAPLGPINPAKQPRGIEKLTFLTASMVSYLREKRKPKRPLSLLATL
jgi:hypothetical protein